MPKTDALTERPDLWVDDRNLPKAAIDLCRVFRQAGNVYERGEAVVTINTQSASPSARPLDTHSVVMHAHSVCQPRNTKGEPITLSTRLAQLFLSIKESGLPILNGITTAPILDDDGTIRTAEGYDAASGLYSAGIARVDVEAYPTKADAETALTTLRTAFKSLAFADAPAALNSTELPLPAIAHDESAFLNALMTASCRASVPLAPGLLVRAPKLSGRAPARAW